MILSKSYRIHFLRWLHFFQRLVWRKDSGNSKLFWKTFHCYWPSSLDCIANAMCTWMGLACWSTCWFASARLKGSSTSPCHVIWAHLSLCMSGNKEPGGLNQLCLRHCVQLLPLPQTMLDELLADNLSLLLLGKHTTTFVIPILMF